MSKQNFNTAVSTVPSKSFSYKKVTYFIMFLIAFAIYVLQKQHIVLPVVINNYVNDLLCMPLVFGAITFALRQLKKDSLFTLSFVFIIIMTSFYALYFEFYLPQFNSRYTADWIDVLLYFSGAIGFFFMEKDQNLNYN